MKVLHEQPPFSIIRFQGRIEVIKAVRQYKDGAHIGYVRVNEDAAGATVLQDVAVGNAVESHLQEGTDCKLYALCWGGRERLIFAVDIGGEKIFDPAENQQLRDSLVRQALLVWGTVIGFGLLMCLLVLFLYIGLPLALWASWRMKGALERAQLPIQAMSAVLRDEAAQD